MKLFVFGLGYSARAVVKRLRPQLDEVWGTTRDPGRLAGLEGLGVEPVLWNGAEQLAPEGPTPSPSPQGGGEQERGPPPPLWGRVGEGVSPKLTLPDAGHVLVSIAPGPDGDPVLRHFGKELAASRPRSLVYLSTVGVYGDHGGAWVDETSPCRPVSARSRERVAAEAEWQRFGVEAGVPVAIIRLSGIYGPGRGPFEKIRKGTARRVIKPGQVFNRIHVEDIAAIVEAAFAHGADGVFNGTDDEPAPPETVLDFAARLLGVAPPPIVRFETAEMTPMARSFYGENKRVRNGRIKEELGVRLAYPTYREGLPAVLEAERNQRACLERSGQ